MGHIAAALVDALDYALADVGIVVVDAAVAADVVVRAPLDADQAAPGIALVADLVAMPDARLLALGDAGMTAARVIAQQLAGWIALADAAVGAVTHVDLVVVLAVVLHVQMALGLLKFV